MIGGVCTAIQVLELRFHQKTEKTTRDVVVPLSLFVFHASIEQKPKKTNFF